MTKIKHKEYLKQCDETVKDLMAETRSIIRLSSKLEKVDQLLGYSTIQKEIK